MEREICALACEITSQYGKFTSDTTSMGRYTSENLCLTYVTVDVTTQLHKGYIAQHMAGDQTKHSLPNYDINFKCAFPLALIWLSLALPDGREEQSDAKKKNIFLNIYFRTFFPPS